VSKRSQPKSKVTISPAAKQRLARATDDLAIAERELKHSLDTLPVTLRADKRMVSDGLRLALDKVADAKNRLQSVLKG
jgi:hypothetical protein